MSFKINLAPAEEGFIQNLKDKHAAKKKEKGRRHMNPDQTFSNVDAALAYAKDVYAEEGYPYYLEMDVANDKMGVVIHIANGKTPAELSHIQACIANAQKIWKRVLKAVAEEFYTEGPELYAGDFNYLIDTSKVSKSQFVASCTFNGMSINGTNVEYYFYSTIMDKGYLVQDMDNGIGAFNGKACPELRD